MTTRSRSLKVQGAKYQHTLLGVASMIGVGFFLQNESLDTVSFRGSADSARPKLFPSFRLPLSPCLASGSVAFGSQGGCLSSRKHTFTPQHPKIKNGSCVLGSLFFRWGPVFSPLWSEAASCGQGAGQAGSVPCVLRPFLSPPACGGRRWDLKQVLGLPRSGACCPASGCSRHTVLLC